MCTDKTRFSFASKSLAWLHNAGTERSFDTLGDYFNGLVNSMTKQARLRASNKKTTNKTRGIMNHFTASQHWYSWWAKWGLQKPTPVRLSHAASVFHLLWLTAGRLPLFLRRQVLRLYCCWFLKPGAVLWPWGTNRRWGLKLPWEWFWPWRPLSWLCLKPNLFGSSEPWELDLKV